MKSLTIDDKNIFFQQHKIPYKIKRNSNSKGLSLRIKEDVLIIVASVMLKDMDIKKLLVDNSDWVGSFLNKYYTQNEEKNNTHIRSCYYLGKTYDIKVEQSSLAAPIVLLEQDYLLVKINSYNSLIPAVYGWLRGKASQYISLRTKHISEKLNIEYNNVFIKDQSTRWGSCSSKGNINLNFRLIMAPPNVIDYVIIHELCHRVHMNHSKDFWALVQTLDPQYKFHRNWLKQYGKLLKI